ncbi:MAG TPA: hypothetical protein VEK57_17850 [Thermoanaerobaculia bacterium]|nr:hypothetical protein [Thermoanaerobaculia bacterium]
MFPRAPRALALLLALLTLALLGCNRSPTAPHSAAELLGVWEGALEAHPAGEDWSRVRIRIEAVGGTLSGTLTSRDGVVHPISIDGMSIGIGQLPQITPCSVTLLVERVSFSAIQGRLSGRCANTLMGSFRLERAQ